MNIDLVYWVIFEILISQRYHAMLVVNLAAWQFSSVQTKGQLQVFIDMKGHWPYRFVISIIFCYLFRLSNN